MSLSCLSKRHKDPLELGISQCLSGPGTVLYDTNKGDSRIDFLEFPIPTWKFGSAFQGPSNSVIQMGSVLGLHFQWGLLTSHGVKGKQFVVGFINRVESQHNPNITQFG